MKCFECRKEIEESKGYKVTAPDGDCFHNKCLIKYEKDRDVFFKRTVHNDRDFANWLNVPESVVKTNGT